MMLFAQANAVSATWLQQAWIFGAVILSMLLGPMVAVWISNRRQKREVTQAEEYITKGTCNLMHSNFHVEMVTVKQEMATLRNRVDTVETEVNRNLRELRNEVMNAINGMRGDVTHLVKAVGQLQGQIELGRRHDERT